MKLFRFSLLSALLFSGATYAHGAPTEPEYAPGEILVRVKTTASAKVRRYALANGAKVVRSYGSTGWQRIKLPANVDVKSALATYQKQTGVTAVEPNYRIQALKTPNDKRFRELYGMAKIGAPTAWNVNSGSNDVVVAVCDSGIKYDHPDLAANMWKNKGEKANNGKDDDGNGIVDDVHGYDAYNADGSPMDDNGHGTHCAGTIGAVGNNSVGVAGVNWKVKLMALKILGADGSGFTTSAMEAYDYAISMKKSGVNLRVISNSWGGLGRSIANKAIMQEAADNGIISICAAGNDHTNIDAKPFTPAAEDVTGMVCVGASDDEDRIAEYSNYGRKGVDLFAPGSNILSTWIGKGEDAYAFLDGTSMACPHVSGAAALIIAQAPGLSVEAVKARLLEAVDVLPQFKDRSVTSGRLNLAKLLSNGIYSVRGTVFDNAKKPLAGAEIFINGASTPSAISSLNGTYSVDGLKPGTYKASAKLKGWKFTPEPKQVSLGTAGSYVAKVDFTGKTTAAVYDISGTVVLRTKGKNVPLKGVRLYIAGSKEAVAITDAQGKYAITGRGSGTYFIFAELGDYAFRPVGQISLDGSAKVVLPARSPATATADFVATAAGDFTPPVVTVKAPISGSSYPSGLTRAYGTAYDPSGVDEIYFALQRVTDEGSVFYEWETKTWSDPVRDDGFIVEIPDAAFLVQDFNEESVQWSVDFPTLEPGEYVFSNFPYDNLGNGYFYDFSQPFTVGSSETATVYPKVTITAPTTAKTVPANTSTLAKGLATDDNGVDDVYVYLRRYDERGRVLTYYNWVTKKWISPVQFDEDCYFTFDGRDRHSVEWSVRLPGMVAGQYELGALGRDSDDNEPPLDGSEDTLSNFTVRNPDGSASSTAPSAASS